MVRSRVRPHAGLRDVRGTAAPALRRQWHRMRASTGAPELTFPGVERGQALQRRDAGCPPRGDDPRARRPGAGQGPGPRPTSLPRRGRRDGGRAGDRSRPNGDRVPRAGYPGRRAGRRDGAGARAPAAAGGTPGRDAVGRRARLAARAAPGPPGAHDDRPKIEAAAINALAGRSGGIAVAPARDRRGPALAGTAYSSPGPPGSTFKIMTATGALEAQGQAADSFPVADGGDPRGRRLNNATASRAGARSSSRSRTRATPCSPLGARSARSAWSRRRSRSASTAAPSSPARTSTIPAGMRSATTSPSARRRSGRARASGDDAADGARSAARSGNRAASRISPTSTGPRAAPARVIPRRIADRCAPDHEGRRQFGTGRRADITASRSRARRGRPSCEAVPVGPTRPAAAAPWSSALTMLAATTLPTPTPGSSRSLRRAGPASRSASAAAVGRGSRYGGTGARQVLFAGLKLPH